MQWLVKPFIIVHLTEYKITPARNHRKKIYNQNLTTHKIEKGVTLTYKNHTL